MDDRFDGFAVNLYLDNENAWIAHFMELPEISAFSDTPETALSELVTAWSAVKATYQEEGLPVPLSPSRKHYSGTFNVRIDKTLHCSLATEAARLGVSLNAIITKKLIETTRSFPAR